MKTVSKSIYFIYVIIFAFTSCTNGGLLGGSDLGGKAGELLIVINDEYKNSQTSESITEIMNQYELGLTQSEPPFSILMISRNHFSSVFRSHRNILFIDIHKKFTSPIVQFKKMYGPNNKTI